MTDVGTFAAELEQMLSGNLVASNELLRSYDGLPAAAKFVFGPIMYTVGQPMTKTELGTDTDLPVHERKLASRCAYVRIGIKNCCPHYSSHVLDVLISGLANTNFMSPPDVVEPFVELLGESKCSLHDEIKTLLDSFVRLLTFGFPSFWDRQSDWQILRNDVFQIHTQAQGYLSFWIMAKAGILTPISLYKILYVLGSHNAAIDIACTLDAEAANPDYAVAIEKWLKASVISNVDVAKVRKCLRL